MSPKTDAKKTAKKSGEGFTDAEKAAMKARAQEMKAEARANKNREEGEKAVFAAITQMKGQDGPMAKRLHEVITAAAPELMPKTWYGMPAYVDKDEKVVCFFQTKFKFNYKYATLGFQDAAHLDDGAMWPVAFALKELNSAEEKQVIALIKKEIGRAHV